MHQNKTLTDLKNIGVKLANRLNEVSIYTEDDLRLVGAVGAHRVIKERYPQEKLPLCYYLYSFEGALQGKHWNEIGDKRKRELCRQVAHLDTVPSNRQTPGR